MAQKAVVTIATGKKYFIDLASNLARSFLLHNQTQEISFRLVTDQISYVPEDLKKKIEIFEIPSGRYGRGFETKLFLDQFSEARQTLFIDADCLIYDDLNIVFEKLKGNSVTAIGDNIKSGDFFCDVALTTEKLQLGYMPRFVGGIYYFERTDTAQKVFEYARELKPQYDDLGLIRLRGSENEEPLIALAMAKYGLRAYPEDGSIKADRMFYSYCDVNVLKGRALFWNEEAIIPKAYFHLKESKPIVGHFNASFAENYEYLSESTRLKLFSKTQSKIFANAISQVFIVWPGKLKSITKDFLRPIFHFFFGTRKIKPSKRIL